VWTLDGKNAADSGIAVASDFSLGSQSHFQAGLWLSYKVAVALDCHVLGICLYP
jgi:hypothetical protein